MEHIDVSNHSLASQEAEIVRFVIRTTDLKDPVSPDSDSRAYIHKQTLNHMALRYETSVYDRWCTGVDEICSFNLMQPIITRDPETSLIAVNFDPQVISIRPAMSLP